MSKKPDNPSEAAALRSLLAAVLDALTVPHDTGNHGQRLAERAMWARTAAKGALEEDPADVGWNTDFLRGKLAAEEAEAAEKAVRASVDRAFPAVARFLADERAEPANHTQAADRCARCRWTFDPNDKKHDGRARHRDTQWCRRCVDNCHEGSAEHVCVICEPKRYGGGR